jgi:hypothetical protein
MRERGKRKERDSREDGESDMDMVDRLWDREKGESRMNVFAWAKHHQQR